MVNIEEIYKTTYQKYHSAKSALRKIEKRALYHAAISDVVPGYKADDLNFESYDEDKFGVLFIDMRGSTNRAERIGAEKTFLSMHAFIPAMIEVVKHYKGNVIDIMGDGLMVFFGGKKSVPKLTEEYVIQNSGLCGQDMLNVLERVVNKILSDDGITWKIDCGVGIDYGKVIVTKIGINDIFDVKAFGSCINDASKYSKVSNTVKVSKYVRRHWPKGKGGKISFSGNDSDGYILIDNR